ncbi:protein RALF-like 7 [Dorcoceras hygrometricum]|uniref:Protein RALF-like 7 n=1 Tax=Dorcoceras hygrometricum TaxID=472368 RepID=A0A2Z7C1H9_9LAMI|nr:protein RALF-like 7 [Dorcoceras hygrometricum]
MAKASLMVCIVAFLAVFLFLSESVEATKFINYADLYANWIPGRGSPPVAANTYTTGCRNKEQCDEYAKLHLVRKLLSSKNIPRVSLHGISISLC